MAGNSFGKLFTLTSFGESHGIALGGVIDGCPAGIKLDFEFIQAELDKRKPGQSAVATPRKEDDVVEFLSGVFEGTTTGTSIGFIIRNKNQESKDYNHLKDVFRPSHADYTYQQKYGIRDHRGGGRSSARETACRVVAGAIAKQLLKTIGVEIKAYVSAIGDIKTSKNYKELDLTRIENTIVRCPDESVANQMIESIEENKKIGDTLGGIITCVANKCPVGLGEPVFDKLNADLAKAMLSINAVKGFEIGSGFSSTTKKGSELNDSFYNDSESIHTKTNNSGGVQGGISNGEDIYFNVAFKPVATILQNQKTINSNFENIEMKASGRHDTCVVPRATVIVEAMTALVLADHYLRNKTSKI